MPPPPAHAKAGGLSGGADPEPDLDRERAEILAESPASVQRNAMLAAAKLRTSGAQHAVPVNETILVKLNDAERNVLARNAASLYAQHAKLKGEFASVKNDWKERLKEVEGAAQSDMRQAENGEAPRRVDALRVFDTNLGVTWIEYRGDRYDRREMRDSERRAFESKNMFEDAPRLPGDADPPPPTVEEARAAAESLKAQGLKPANGDGSKPKAKREPKPKLEVVSAFNADAATAAAGGSSSQDIRDVMRDEKSVRGKADHLA